MNEDQFAAFLACAVVPPIIQLIRQKTGQNALEAVEKFYHSELYSLLEKEDTKIWHYSALTLFNMYASEMETGKIAFPEEAA